MQIQDPITRALDARIAALAESTRLSAWSLIVTFMGDAVGPRGGEVSAAALQTLMARLGIGHGAVRTAISRLSADGWIERKREGRNSFYRLSPDVAETVISAEQRIYAKSSLLPPGTPVTLVLADGPIADALRLRLEHGGALPAGDQAFLWFGATGGKVAALLDPALTTATVSDLKPGPGLRARVAEARLSGECAALNRAYLPFDSAFSETPALAPQDAMALRCLMIHEWRRVALRVLAVPAGLAGSDDPEPAARGLIAAIYRRVLAASETWLDEHATTASGPLPPADARLMRRFGGF